MHTYIQAYTYVHVLPYRRASYNSVLHGAPTRATATSDVAIMRVSYAYDLLSPGRGLGYPLSDPPLGDSEVMGQWGDPGDWRSIPFTSTQIPPWTAELPTSPRAVSGPQMHRDKVEKMDVCKRARSDMLWRDINRRRPASLLKGIFWQM